MSDSIGLKDYLDSVTESGKRTRAMMIVLLVASVLALVALLNSFKYGWIHQRIETMARDPNYVLGKVGYANPWSDEEKAQAIQASNDFRAALIRAYIDNAFTIRVPFFGVAFDVNYLGLLGGIGFTAILTLLRYSTRNEMTSVEVAFRAAVAANQLVRFYDLLVTRQVFTLPKLDGAAPPTGPAGKRPQGLIAIPRLVIFLPVAVYTLVLVNDLSTILIGININPIHTVILILYTAVFEGVTIYLSYLCLKTWREMDDLWERWWKRVMPGEQAQRVARPQEDGWTAPASVGAPSEPGVPVRPDGCRTTEHGSRYASTSFPHPDVGGETAGQSNLPAGANSEQTPHCETSHATE